MKKFNIKFAKVNPLLCSRKAREIEALNTQKVLDIKTLPELLSAVKKRLSELNGMRYVKFFVSNRTEDMQNALIRLNTFSYDYFERNGYLYEKKLLS